MKTTSSPEPNRTRWTDFKKAAGALLQLILQKLPPRRPAVGLKAVIDRLSTPVMVLDANSCVSYANRSAEEMVAANRQDFRSLWPDFAQRDIVGARIATPINTHSLPVQTELSLGPLRLPLCTTGILDDHDRYVGSVLEWANVLELRKRDFTADPPVEQADVAGRQGNDPGFWQTLCEDLQTLTQNAGNISGSSDRLKGISEMLVTHAETTAGEAEEISAASDEVSGSVAIMESGGAKMIESIREISASSAESARVAQVSVGMAESASYLISKLGVSSTEIGKVVSIISSIARQTNMLALNASIEAAHAGDAGSGFDVVAREVKSLAIETAKATSEVVAQIEAIQSDTKSAVQAIGDIQSIVLQISTLANSIAVAVEAQNTIANQMGRNVKAASRGAKDIASHITGVAVAAQNATLGAHETLQGLKDLGALASEMDCLVARLNLSAGPFIYIASCCRSGWSLVSVRIPHWFASWSLGRVSSWKFWHRNPSSTEERH